MSVRTYLVESREPKDFAHEIDAAEWSADGLVTYEAPGKEAAPKPEPKPDPDPDVIACGVFLQSLEAVMLLKKSNAMNIRSVDRMTSPGMP